VSSSLGWNPQPGRFHLIGADISHIARITAAWVAEAEDDLTASRYRHFDDARAFLADLEAVAAEDQDNTGR
jgi:hypothetical protein